jgi:transcriptional regulator with XRE-family HTH domain
MRTKNKNFSPAAATISMSSGEMVRTLRELKGWSQIDLAKASKISQTNISAIENDRIQVGKERAIALAEALNVHPAAIMFADYVYAA